MDGYSISQVAERTGFPPTTLRFYEQSGLVCPARTPAGYRCYDDSHIELLSFIGRAKGFGLSLEEITDLLGLLGDDECAPVQGRLRDLVDAKILDARAKITELEAFTVELGRVAAALGVHTPTGPCDDTCGCTTDDPAALEHVVLGRRDLDGDAPVIACTLSVGEVGDRLAQWETIVAAATDRTAIASGTRLTFRRDVDVAALAGLVAAEQDCCRFLTFAITVGLELIDLDVTGPPEAQPVIDTLTGVAS